MLIKRLVSKFVNYRITDESDRLANYNLTFETDTLPELSEFYEIEGLLKEYPKRDSLDICFKSSQDDFFSLTMKNGELDFSGPNYIVTSNKIDEIITSFNDLRIIEDKIEVRIKIEKEYNRGLISIYSLDKFINWIMGKGIYGMMTFFSDIYNFKDSLIFISYDEEIEVVTDTFKITNENELIKTCTIDRVSILNSRLEITNIKKTELNIVPEDFNVKKYVYKDTDLKNKLNSIRNILSVVHISDVSLIQEEFSEFRINGYKSSDFKINYEESQRRAKNDHLYGVYKWIYNEGNLIDKSIIARNIVSLHCRYQNILDLDSEILNSIETNYAYYLKTNTDEFLEEKKDLRLSIIEEGKLLSEALYGFIGNMGKNLIAYFTFLATLMISTTLANEKFEDIFTDEIVQIIALIVLGSFLFLIFSNIEASYKRERVKDYVEDLINGYGFVLGKENAREIINEVKSYKNVEKTFHCKKNLISLLWVVFNFILLLVLDWISKDIKILGIMNIL